MSTHPIMWTLRALWVALPLVVVGPAAQTLDEHSTPVAVTAAVLAWALFAVVLISSVIPSPLSLTCLRTLVPVSVPFTAWVAVESSMEIRSVAALVIASAATAVALSGWVADINVDGASYGDEVRFILRSPGAFLIGPIPVIWAATVASATAGPLLVAAGAYAAGAAVMALAAVSVVVAGMSFHALSRRWLVFVPAGVTVVDHIALADPVMFQTAGIVRFGRAEVGTDAVDLSGAALGSPLEIRTKQPSEMTIRTEGNEAEVQRHPAVIVAVARPGAVLAEADRRGIRVDPVA